MDDQLENRAASFTRRCLLFCAAAAASAALAVLAALPAQASRSAAVGRIAFEAAVSGKQQLFTINPDGTGLKQLTHLDSPGLWGDAWSPDNGAIVFSASGKGPDLLYRVSPDGGAVTRISPGCTGKCLGDDFPAFSRSGSKIAFERAYGPITNNTAAVVGIFTMNATGGDLKQLIHRSRPTSSEDHHPDWSPDGKKIVFERLNTTAAPAGGSAIFIMNADGTSVRRLTPYALAANYPKWSPDGTTIVFDSHEDPAPGEDANIYSMRPDGSAIKQLTHYRGGKLNAFLGDWSPDGARIVFPLRGADPNGPGTTNSLS
jgi:Tol biopolymer transport system component